MKKRIPGSIVSRKTAIYYSVADADNNCSQGTRYQEIGETREQYINRIVDDVRATLEYFIKK